jgi:uncharacterized YccA/Bax inhibitor family protein
MVYRYNNFAIRKLANYTGAVSETATYSGIALKCLYFVLLTFVSAAASFILIAERMLTDSPLFLIILIGAPFAAFICSLIASFRPSAVPVAGSLYAVLQGITIGFVSFIYELYSNVVFAALISTVGSLLIMMVLYYTGVIRVGSFFKKFMLSALLGIIITQLLLFLLSIFFPQVGFLFYGDTTLSLIISIIMVVVASLMILYNLKTIDEVVENNLAKAYEWTAAFGMLITLIWMYLEFLRLFARIAARRNR